MRARFVAPAAAVTVAVAATLAWVPVASAQTTPALSASAALAETPAPDAGSVEITTTDTAGGALRGAAFLLLDSAGQEAGRGETDAQGKLTFPDLAPGVYRLKQTASGSPIHQVVADQDVIITPGATTQLTIDDPFKAATILLQVKDGRTGELLSGATVNIGTGTSTLLTLTTGPQGTASGDVPMTSRTTQFWVKEINAPTGYDLIKPSSSAFTATPGAAVKVTVTDAKTSTSAQLHPTGKPTGAPSPDPLTGGPKSSVLRAGTPDAGSPRAAALGDSDPQVPAAALAHTGAGATPWIAASAAVLLTAGAIILIATRRRTAAETEPDHSGTA